MMCVVDQLIEAFPILPISPFPESPSSHWSEGLSPVSFDFVSNFGSTFPSGFNKQLHFVFKFGLSIT
ncbi:MAG: hypothetical protein CL999_004975 [Methanobacteriota archaeon]|nr:MAG: hypothetical protein CL999_004975 [Euryarchaeota archaeon]